MRVVSVLLQSKGMSADPVDTLEGRSSRTELLVHSIQSLDQTWCVGQHHMPLGLDSLCVLLLFIDICEYEQVLVASRATFALVGLISRCARKVSQKSQIYHYLAKCSALRLRTSAVRYYWKKLLESPSLLASDLSANVP